MSGMVENMRVQVGIAAPSIHRWKDIFTSGLAVAILNSEKSANVKEYREC